jgi:hypothetical protein
MIDKPQQPPSYPLRMPKELRDQLAESAKKNNRSVNAEIISRLEESFSPSAKDEDQAGHAKATTRISKDKIWVIKEEDRPVTKRDLDAAMMDAMMRALDMLDTRKTDRLPDQPTQGPAPRKRYPKE